MALLDVEGLTTEFRTDQGTVEAVNDVDLKVEHGETVGIVGESGSGKSVTALSILDLIDAPGRITDGRINFGGKDLRSLSDEHMRRIRGDDLSMIFQDPMDGLNPVLRIGDQISETLRAHKMVAGEGIDWLERSLIGNFIPQRSAKERHPHSWERAVDLMDEVGIPEPEQRATEFPHQFSGGMLQRAMIAQALAGEPQLLIADEPTTALDVTIQAQILNLLDEIQDAHDMGLLLITHDLGVIVEMCDRVNVMYAGEIVESAPTEELFTNPKHPYTQGLLRSIPKAREPKTTLEPLSGQVPDLIDMPTGCYFAERCPHEHEACHGRELPMYSIDGDREHTARCVLYEEGHSYDTSGEQYDGQTGEQESAAKGGTKS